MTETTTDASEADTESSAEGVVGLGGDYAGAGPEPVEPRWMLVRLLFTTGTDHTMIMQAGDARDLAQRKSDRVNGAKGESRRVDVAGLDQQQRSMRVVCGMDDLAAVILVDMPRPVEAPASEES